ncbi:MAG: DNA-binding transcriptional regulator [Ignavibacteriales bacterium]|nr:DNA-binding transcriptional regulator [Ignavibacteriales bacterium]MBK7981235.1 DNA-binding transcriptional regulator [Ignavibacteriota bacterium]
MAKLKKVILLLESSRAFGRDLLFGIGKYSRINGPWSFYWEPRGLKSSIPHLSKWKADGIIMRNSLIKKELLDLKLPTILALHDTNRPANMPAICTNSESISRLAANHLIDIGLKNFAFCGYDDIEWSNDRKYYFKKIIEEAGFNIFLYNQVTHVKQISWQQEQINMRKWIQSLPKPIGIMACNDDRGQQVLEVCKSLSINVPEEIAVTGVDNDALICDLSDTPLTSVCLNTEQAGYAAAEQLDHMMNEKQKNFNDIIVLGTHIVQRQSTNILAVNDKEVAEAIKFIRNNAKNKIQIKDVVKQTCLGKRSLENRFKKTLHRTINQEIRRVRTEMIKQMLLETNLSISEITSMFDFTSIEHIARYFRKENGQSLIQFRKISQKV